MNNELNNELTDKTTSDSGKKRRSLKGMTLMECIIAMVVLVILASLVAESAVGIVSNLRTSKSVVEKVNYQSHFVSSRSGANTNNINFTLVDGSGASLPDSHPISVQVFESPEDPAAQYADYDKAGNLKYFVHVH